LPFFTLLEEDVEKFKAILNTIYLTEVLKVKNVKDIYMQISPDLLLEKEV